MRAAKNQLVGALSIEHIGRRIARGTRGVSIAAPVGIMPAVSVPPELMDLAIAAAIDHMLGALSIEHIARRVARGTRGASIAARVGMTPPAGLRRLPCDLKLEHAICRIVRPFR